MINEPQKRKTAPEPLALPLIQFVPDYWDRTDNILRRNGGQSPTCPACGAQMAAADDHGRFLCFSCGHHAAF